MPPVDDNPAFPPPQERSVESLMEAMGQGEREAAAEFVVRFGPLIRRRVRGKLRASMRRMFDSQDILSTLSRRLDVYVSRGQFEPRSAAELWGLVFAIAENCVVEKARILQSLVEKEVGLAMEPQTAAPGRPIGVTHGEELEELLEEVPLAIDRQIARMWAMDISSEAIAAELGLTSEVVRTRWRRTRDRLRDHYLQVPS